MPEMLLQNASAIPASSQRGEVHVWRARELHLDAEKLRSILDEEELARASTFHFEADRNRFMLGRGILRELLGRCLNCRPESITLTRDRHGKPQLADPGQAPRVQFNLSHTPGMLLFAISLDRPVGI